MSNFLSWGSIFLFSATMCAVLFQSVILWVALYIVGIICFFLAHRQEQSMFERVSHLESQLRAVTAKNNNNSETP